MLPPNPPHILAIETSTSLLGVALVSDERVLAERQSTIPRVHSKMLLPFCIDVLKESGIGPKHLSALCVSIGPGSFTGLRIGCAVAQGLSLGLGLKVVLVPTWLVLLHQAKDRKAVAIVQGKAKGQTVGAFFVKGFSGVSQITDMAEKVLLDQLGFSPVIEPSHCSFEDFRREIQAFCGDNGVSAVTVTGDAAKEFCLEVSSFASVFQPDTDERLLPRPDVLGRIGSVLFSKGYSVESDKVLPKYYRGFPGQPKSLHKRV